jgi:hypothetical protein
MIQDGQETLIVNNPLVPSAINKAGIYLFLVLLLLTSCNSFNGRTEGDYFYNKVPDPSRLRVVDYPIEDLEDIFAHYEFVQLHLPEDKFLGRVLNVRQDPENLDYLVVADENQLMRFDPNGHFLFEYGTKGGGPGEYFGIFDVALFANGDVFILTPFKILTFSRQGELLIETPLADSSSISRDVNEVEIVDDLIFIRTSGFSLKKDPKDIIVLDRNYHKLYNFHLNDRRERDMPVDVLNRMIQHQGKLVIVSLLDYRISVYDISGTLTEDFFISRTDFDYKAIDEKRLTDRNYLNEIARKYFLVMNNSQDIQNVGHSIYIHNVNQELNITFPSLLNLETTELLRFRKVSDAPSFDPLAFLGWARGTTVDHRLITIPGGLDQDEWFSQHIPGMLPELETRADGGLLPTLMILQLKDSYGPPL